MYDRRMRDTVRYKDGEKFQDLHLPDHAGRLPRRLPRLSARPRPAGRPRPLRLRQHVGQPRVLLARLPGRREVRQGRGPGPDPQGRRQPGLVRVPAGPRGAGRRIASSSSSPRRWSMRRSPLRRPRPGPGAQQPGRDRQPDRLPRAAVGRARGDDPHRPAQLSLRGSVRRHRGRRASASGLPDFSPEEATRDPRRRARLRRRPPARDHPFGDARRAQLPQGRAAADHARRQAEGLVPRARSGPRRPPGRSGAPPTARSTCAPTPRTCRRA